MSMGSLLALIQTIVLVAMLLLVAWQTRELRTTIQTSVLQDIIEKFFRIVEKPDFKRHFSFGDDKEEASGIEEDKDVLCSMMFAYLEQLYLQLQSGHLVREVSRPWAYFVACWINLPVMKRYWGSPSMICPKEGFSTHFRAYVDERHAALAGQRGETTHKQRVDSEVE